MDVHEYFEASVLPKLKQLFDDDNEETGFEKFLQILKQSVTEEFSNTDFKARVIDTLVDPWGDGSRFHENINEVFRLLSGGQCFLEKMVYMDNLDRITVEFEVKEPE